MFCAVFNVYAQDKKKADAKTTLTTAESAKSEKKKNSTKETTTKKAKKRLSAVSGLVVLSADENSVTLGWDEYPDALSYTVRAYDKKTKKYKEVAMTSETTCKIKSLSVGQTYFYKVTALVSDGEDFLTTPASNVLKAVTSPKAVTSIWTDSITKDSITLRWKKPSGASRYEIWVYDKNKNEFILNGTTEKTAYTVKSLTENTVYSFKLRAIATTETSRAYSAFSPIYTDFTDKNGTPVTKSQAAAYYNSMVNKLKKTKSCTVSHKKTIEASALSCTNTSILRTVKNIVLLFNGTKKDKLTFKNGTSGQMSLNSLIQPYDKVTSIRGGDIKSFSFSKKNGESKITINLKPFKSNSSANDRAFIGANVDKVSISPITIEKHTQSYESTALTLTVKDGKIKKMNVSVYAVADADCEVSTVKFNTSVGYVMNESYSVN